MKLTRLVALLSITFHAAFSQQNIASFQEITATQALGDKVYFTALDNQYGRELFVSNGKGNTLLKDINPGYSGSSPSELTVFNNQIFFIAYSPDYGSSLWKTDGTAAGTQLVYGVKDAEPASLMVFKDKLYFRTNLGSIMRTDGTAAGTQAYFQAGYGYGRIQTVKKNDQFIYFTSDGRTIYRDNGTTRISFLAPLSWEDVYYKDLLPLGNSLVVVKSSSNDNTIRIYAIDNNIVHDQGEDEWTLIKKLDAPIYGTQVIKNFTIIGGKMFFNFRRLYENVSPTDELWISDGTDAGTNMLKNFASTPYSGSNIGMFFEFHGKLFLRTGNYLKQEIWTSDGTTDGTVKFHDTSIVADYNDPGTPVLTTDDKFYFSGGTMENAELWNSDGTTQGTKQLLDLDDAGSSWPHDLCYSNGILYFLTSKQFLATLWSTVPSPDISLWDHQTSPIASGATATLFYNVAKGACQTSEIVIKNKGLSQLYFGNIYITGRDFYLVKQNLPEMLAPGESVAITIVFNPVVDGKSNATLTILSNDTDEPRYTVNLQSIASTSSISQVCKFQQNEYIKTLVPAQSLSSIVLSNATITEDQPKGTAIGQFALASPATFTLISGEGDTDNGDFLIDGNQLRSNTVFDYNERTLYSIRVKASTSQGEVEASFRVVVNNVSVPFVSDDCQSRFQLMGYGLSAMESNDAGDLFVTTNIGQVMRSTDSGKSWQIVYTGDFFDLATITFKGNSGYIAASNILLKSEDGGASWFRLYLPLTGDYYFNTMGTSFLSDKEGYVATEQGELFFTQDGGRSWETRFQYKGKEFRSLLFSSKDKGYATTGWGYLEQTVDGGRSWTAIDLSALTWDNLVRDVYFISDKKGFLVTNYYVFKTTDGGKSWVQLDGVSGGYSARTKFLNENLGFVYGGEGSIYKTTDGGETWEYTYNYNAPGRAVGLVQIADKIFIATRNTYSSYQTARAISVSSDEGTTWSNLYNYSGSNIYNIKFSSEQKGIILAADGIFRTEDSGITWAQGVTDINGVTDILFTDDNTVMLVSAGNIYKSTNGGATTKLVLKTDTNQVYSPAGKLYASPGNALFSVSWYAMYRSDDLGETWTLVSTLPDYYTQAMQFISPSIGYRIELFGSVEKTVDGGMTWTNIFTHDQAASSPYNAIFYLDENVGYKGGSLLQRTSDGGATWETVKWPFYEIMAIHFENPMHGFVVTRGGLVQETIDGGTNWKTIFSTGSRLADVQFLDEEIFLAGENGFSARMNKTARTPSIPGYIYGADRICAGDAVDFHVAPDSDYRTQWATTAGNVEDRRDFVTVKFSEPGEYTITAKYTNGCGTGDSRTRTVKVSGSPSGPIVDGPDTAVQGEQNIAYAVTDAITGASYLWSAEGGTATSTGDQNVVVDWAADTETAKVNVLEVDASGCRASGSLVVTLQLLVGIEDYLHDHIDIYPNPSDADAKISSSYTDALIIRILDVRGSEYTRYDLPPGSEQNLQTRSLSPGLYLIEISDGKQSVTRKLIRK